MPDQKISLRNKKDQESTGNNKTKNNSYSQEN